MNLFDRKYLRLINSISIFLCFFSLNAQVDPGNALSFNGSGDYVTFPDMAVTWNGDFTVECWVKPDLSTGQQHQYIISNRNASYPSGTGPWFALIIQPNGQLIYHEGDGNMAPGAYYHYGHISMQSGKWYHVAVVKKVDGDTQFSSIYVNGVKDGERSGPFRYCSANQSVQLGAHEGYGKYFKGLVDELRIWSFPRTKENINSWMHEPVEGTEFGLVGYYDFNHAGGTRVYDKSQSPYEDGIMAKSSQQNSWTLSKALVKPFIREVKNQNDGFSVTWDSVPGAQYQFEMAYDKDFNTMAATAVLDHPGIKVDTSSDFTNYYVRVKSITTVESDYSETYLVSREIIPPGNALDFDGIDDHVRLPNGVYFDNSYTVEAWWYIRDYGQYQRLFDFSNGSSTDNVLFSIYSIAGNPNFTIYSSGAKGVFGPDTLPLNQWMHVAVVQNNSNLKMYVNGNKVAEVNDMPIPKSVIRTECYLGRSAWAVDEYLDGKVDEFRIWNAPRSDSAIRANMHGTLSGDEPGLQVYFNFDQISGNTLLDQSPNQIEASLVNMENEDWISSGAVITPVALPAKDVKSNGFTAQWTEIPGATKYYLMVSGQPDFSRLLLHDSTTNNHYNVYGMPVELDKYYYKVIARTHKYSDTSVIMDVVKEPGMALALDGSGTHAYYPGTLIPGTGDFTVSLWAKSIPAAVAGAEFLSQEKSTGEEFYMGVNSNGDLRAGDDWHTVPYKYPTDGQWHHYVLVKTSSNAYFYVDGKMVAEKGSPIRNADGKGFYIGKQYGTHQEYFPGLIDELSIWNTALDQAAVASLNKRFVDAHEPNLVAYYKFNQENNSLVKDHTPNINHLEIKSPAANNYAISSAVIHPVALPASQPGFNSFTARWKPNDSAEKYFVEVSAKDDFSQILAFDSTNNSSIGYTSLSGFDSVCYYRVWCRAARYSDTSSTIKVLRVPDQYLSLDGANKMVVIDKPLDVSDKFSFATWVRVRNISESYPILFAANDLEKDFFFCYYFDLEDHSASFVVKNPNKEYSMATYPVTFDEWFHAAVTCERDGMLRFYINGELIDEVPAGNYGFYSPWKDNLLSIGGYPGSSTRSFEGDIDELSFWNRQLSPEEIKEIMYSPLEGDENGLLMYYQFDQMVNGLLKDKAMQNLDGKLNSISDSDFHGSTRMLTPVARPAGSIDSTSFVAQWDSIPGCNEYHLEIAEDETFKTVISTMQLDTNSALVSSLIPGTEYFFRVKSVTYKESDWSNIIRLQTIMPVPGIAVYLHDGAYIVERNLKTTGFRNGYTFETWIKIDSSDNRSAIFAFNENRSILFYNFDDNSKSELRFYTQEYGYADPVHIPLEEWVHVAIVFQPYYNCHLYINGERKLTFVSNSDIASFGDFTLGTEYDGASATDMISARYDETRIWDSPLSGQEIKGRMHVSLNGNEKDLVLWYNYDSRSGEVIHDQSGNQYDGQIINAGDTIREPSMAIIQPTVRKATEITYNSFVAHWDTIAGIDDYHLEMSTDKAFSTIDSVKSITGQGHYKFINLKDDTTYFYRLKYTRDTLVDYTGAESTKLFARKPFIVHDSIFSICQSDSLGVEANLMNNNTYQWFRDDVALQADTLPEISIEESGDYYFLAIDTLNSNDTAWSDTIHFNVYNDQFDVGFVAIDSTLGATQFVDNAFTAEFVNKTPFASEYNFSWDFGNDSVSEDVDPVVKYPFNGVYTVKLVAENKLTGCKDSMVKNDYIICEGGNDPVTNRIYFEHAVTLKSVDICPGDTIVIHCEEKNADGYQWFRNNLALGGQTGSYINVSDTGYYHCQLMLDGYNPILSDKLEVNSYAVPDLVVSKSGTFRDCSLDTVYLLVNDQNGQYQWSNGETNDSIRVEQPGEYWVHGTTSLGNCTIDTAWFVLEGEDVPLTQICMVSIDEPTGKNMVVWENNPDYRVSGYNIYRLESTGYQEIGSKAKDDIGIHVDPNGNQVSFPEVYKMTTIDTCGNESALDSAESHRPLFLSYRGIDGATGGVVLEWEYYEVNEEALGFDRYVIMRGTDSSALQAFDTVMKANGTVYIDASDVAKTQKVYYRVYGEWTSSCAPAGHLKSNNGPFSRTLSNLEDNRQKGTMINLASARQGLSVFPNPMEEHATITFSNPSNETMSLRIYDTRGTVIRGQDNITGNTVLIQKQGLIPGLYVLEIRGSRVDRGKLIVK